MKQIIHLLRFTLIITIMLLIPVSLWAQTGKWHSPALNESINYQLYEPESPALDAAGAPMTIVYLIHPGFKLPGKINLQTCIEDFLSEGYRVISLDYHHSKLASTPGINQDIRLINQQMATQDFCGFKHFSPIRSYILFEGYLIKRDIPFFKDNPAVYNVHPEYTDGDSLRMDIIYPARTKKPVPVILSFSYSNSYPTYNQDTQQFTDLNRNQRLNLGNTLAGFGDTFLEGAPAAGMAWAIADHPKYCTWGGGKPANGPNSAYKSFQTNPDAAQKVKSAVRTLRALSPALQLSGQIAIYGFSRGADAGALAVGDKHVDNLMQTGFYGEQSDAVQAAILGPGVFDFTIIYNHEDDGDRNLETRCPQVWGELEENRDFWISMGATWLAETHKSAPVLFFYNTTDSPYYADQVRHFRSKLERSGVETQLLLDYGKGHSVPQQSDDLHKLYGFLQKRLSIKMKADH